MAEIHEEKQTALLESIRDMLNTLGDGFSAPAEFSEEEMRQAAYALNLCTVSVSQIIDYDDIYVLDQEYDAILNNLNLEVMPKDEALLDILKQLLNTITFFKIQNEDKRFLDLEYQQKMKNAIWSAVPNLSVISMGSPLAMGVSLATQVGIGYMNYRSEKARVKSENEREKWQLRKSAMEQFNALRRELLDTAWRLADKYQFPDAYRITEHQITRYNAALADPDDLRRYERLLCMADKFEAYPPFWYYLGHAANLLAQSSKYNDQIKAGYREKASLHFEKFIQLSKRNLLREDQILASCALEYFDLLNEAGTDKGRLEGLLCLASDTARNIPDVMELVGLAYMKIGDYQAAGRILRMLINENYNKTVNAQLLSHIYVSGYLSAPSDEIRHKYDTLAARVQPNVLYPMPAALTEAGADEVALQNQFAIQQRRLLMQQYVQVIDNMMAQAEASFEASIPLPRSCKEQGHILSRQEKYDAIIAEIGSPQKNGEYCLDLDGFLTRQTDSINSFYEKLRYMPGIDDDAEIYFQILRSMQLEKSKLQDIHNDISRQKITPRDIDILAKKDFQYYVQDGVSAAIHQVGAMIEDLASMPDFSNMETALREFCVSHGVPVPELEVEQPLSVEGQLVRAPRRINAASLLGGGKDEELQEEIRSKMAEILRAFKEKGGVKAGKQLGFYLCGSREFNDYYKRHKKDLPEKHSILAILNDMSIKDEDWMFTVGGICCYSRSLMMKKAENSVPYREISSNEAGTGFLIKRHRFENKAFNYQLMKAMFFQLGEIETQYIPSEKFRATVSVTNRMAWLNQEFNISDHL